MSFQVIVHRRVDANQLGAKLAKPSYTVIGSPIECFWGTAYFADGQWRCPSGSDVPPAPPNPDTEPSNNPVPADPIRVAPPRTVFTTKAEAKAAAAAAAAADDGLIFGFEPTTLLIIAGVGAALYFMSQSGGPEVKTKSITA